MTRRRGREMILFPGCKCCGGGGGSGVEYCNCSKLDYEATEISVVIKNLAFSTDPSYPPSTGYNDVNSACSESEIISNANLGPYILPFSRWQNYSNISPDPLPPNPYLAPTWEPTTQTPPLESDNVQFVCSSEGGQFDGRLSVFIQQPLFEKLPCQQDYDPGTPNGAILQPVDNYFVYRNYSFGSFPEQYDMFCRLVAGETISIDTATPQTGEHTVRLRNTLNPTGSLSSVYRYMTATIELSLNPLP
jgi:hypothetical protein